MSDIDGNASSSGIGRLNNNLHNVQKQQHKQQQQERRSPSNMNRRNDHSDRSGRQGGGGRSSRVGESYSTDYRNSGSGGRRGGGGSQSQRYDVTQKTLMETGLVEKMCDAYGFIDCDDRKQKLFFHYSHCESLDDLTVGDYVGFTVVLDTHTQKNVGFEIRRLPVVAPAELEASQEAGQEAGISKRVAGQIWKKARGKFNSEYECPGWISYEYNGEKHRIAYLASELAQSHNNQYGNPHQALQYSSGDAVEFSIGPNENGRRLARNVTLSSQFDSEIQGERGYGVVSSIKDCYGFISRDPKFGNGDIFFHFSGVKGMDPINLREGDDVEYSESNKSDKLRAVDVVYIAPDQMEIISDEVFTGKVKRILPRSPNNLNSNSERESKGVIAVITGETGSSPPPVPVGDEALNEGDDSVDGADVCEKLDESTVVDSSITTPPPGGSEAVKGKRGHHNKKQILTFRFADQVDNELVLGKGDIVTFMKCTHKRTMVSRAVGVALVSRAPEKIEYGIICGMNKSFGFVERATHLACLFFHYNDIIGENGEESIFFGCPVKFSVIMGKKPCAKRIEPISAEEMPEIKIESKDETPLFGRVDKIFAAVAFPADRYGGIASFETPNMEILKYPFGVIGLPDATSNPALLLGESISFRRGIRVVNDSKSKSENKKFEAIEVRALYLQSELQLNEKKKGKVVTVSEGGGEVECDKKIIPYYLCEVMEGNNLIVGEEVVLTTAENRITKVQNACRITRSRLRMRKIVGLAAPTFGPIRQPFLPHGTHKGFLNRTGAKQEPVVDIAKLIEEEIGSDSL
eukprot:CFRG7909T1